jgi:type I restriction enzyme R subunit
LEKITDYIIANHGRKTHNKDFSALFCVDSVKSLIKYYDIFKRKKLAGEHNLNIATIFSYAANEEDADANGMIQDDITVMEDSMPVAAEPQATYHSKGQIKALPVNPINKHSREKLDECIDDYNQMYNTKYSTKTSEDFYNYYNDISKKLKDRERSPENTGNRIDILLVVNMFLTGFDAKKVNTLYVDKNLKYHGLIQAYSRTNRILNETKSQGNIVVFRNLKGKTDEAITLFSNKEAIEVIIMQPYEDYVGKFDDAYDTLKEIAPTIDAVNQLVTEEDELNFIKAFRDLMRIKNILVTFSDFKWEDFKLAEQEFEDYKSKYLDLYEKSKPGQQKEKVSILEDVDFELELIHRDEINVTYIIQLLIKLKSKKDKGSSSTTEKDILNLLNTEVTLRSKRELIEKFISENLPNINEADDVTSEFDQYWTKEKQDAFDKLVAEESLSPERTEKLIEGYLFAERTPMRDEVLELIEGEKPSLLQRKKSGDRILQRILDYVETFIDGMMG